MAIRYGDNFAARNQAVSYGEAINLSGVDVSFHPAGHVLGSAQILLAQTVYAPSSRAITNASATRPAKLLSLSSVTRSSARRHSALPVFRHAQTPASRSTNCLPRKSFSRNARISSARMRLARHNASSHSCARPATTGRSISTARWKKSPRYYQSVGINLGDVRKAAGAGALPAGEIVLCPPSAVNDLWARKFAEPLPAFASGWMRIRAHARQRGIELPLVISDHADWDGLCATISETGCRDASRHARRGRRPGALSPSARVCRPNRCIFWAMAMKTPTDATRGPRAAREPLRRPPRSSWL